MGGASLLTAPDQGANSCFRRKRKSPSNAFSKCSSLFFLFSPPADWGTVPVGYPLRVLGVSAHSLDQRNLFVKAGLRAYSRKPLLDGALGAGCHHCVVVVQHAPDCSCSHIRASLHSSPTFILTLALWLPWPGGCQQRDEAKF